MKYLFVFLLLGLVSCGDASSNASENVKPKLKEYSWDDVTIPNDTMAFFKNDMKPVTGIVREWYENGQLRFEYNFKDGEWDGLQREWYKNGQLRFEYPYKDGEWDGLQRAWKENGQLLYEWNNKDAAVDPYSMNGQLESRGPHKDGKHAGEVEF